MNNLIPVLPPIDSTGAPAELPTPAEGTFHILLYAQTESSSAIRRAIEATEAFLSLVNDLRDVLTVAMMPIPRDDLRDALRTLVASWPNGSGGELGGYMFQLLIDLAETRPTRYAIDHGFRDLRRTCRFVPSIAEVLAAVEAAQTKVRNLSGQVRMFPPMLADAREALQVAERREAAGGSRLRAAE